VSPLTQSHAMYDVVASVVEEVRSTSRRRCAGGTSSKLSAWERGACGSRRPARAFQGDRRPDASTKMLAARASSYRARWRDRLVDLRIRRPAETPLDGTFPLVAVPFRTLLQMEPDQRQAGGARCVIGKRLPPRTALLFDVFTPARRTSPRRTAAARARGRDLGAGRLGRGSDAR